MVRDRCDLPVSPGNIQRILSWTQAGSGAGANTNLLANWVFMPFLSEFMKDIHGYLECSSDTADLVTVSFKVKRTPRCHRCRDGQRFLRFQCAAFGHTENVLLIHPGRISPKTAEIKSQVLVTRGSLSTESAPGATDNAKGLIQGLVETNRTDGPSRKEL